MWVMGAALAVEDSRLVVVATGDHRVADSEGAFPVFGVARVARDGRPCESSGGDHSCPCAFIEVHDVSSARSEHDDVLGESGLPLLLCYPPGGDECVSLFSSAWCGGDSAGSRIGIEGRFDVSLAKLVESVAFPCFNLAAVLGQVGGVKMTGQATEGATGGEFGQLFVIAHQHELAVGAGCTKDLGQGSLARGGSVPCRSVASSARSSRLKRCRW
jgi:hypothetical protein